MPSLLFIEDNEELLANLYAWFEPLGYDLDSARDGVAAYELLGRAAFDCIVLDLLLPRMDGFELCRRLRSEACINTPLIMLTARDSVEDRVRGLELGADDYLVKPFSLRELEARIRAILRRPGLRGQSLRFGPLEIFPQERRVLRDGQELRPGPTGFLILEELMRRAPGVVTRERLEELLWGDAAPGSSALRNHILELRRVIDRPFNSDLLKTVPHVGYRLAVS